MFKFANEEVRRQWEAKDSRPQTQAVTKVERKESISYGFTTGRVTMYANPVERERMLIEKAMKQQAETQARFQNLRNQTRTNINGTYNQ